MRRFLGVLLVIHGLAHLSVGIWVYGVNQSWAVTMLWFIATTAFFAAGIGLAGVPALDRRWHQLVVLGAVASLLLLALYARPDPVLVVGSSIDGALLLGSIPFVRAVLSRSIGVPSHPSHRRLPTLGRTFIFLLLAYPLALILMRPWYTRLGVSRMERGPGAPSFVGLTLAPLTLTVFEPAHVIRQGILLGIKQRAERAYRMRPGI